MIQKRVLRSLASLIVFLIFLLLTSLALAAGVGKVSLTVIETDEFPLVKLYLAVSDIDGEPLAALQPAEVTVFENDVKIEPITLEAVQHPMLVGVMIDSSGSFADEEAGKPRLQYAREVASQLVSPDFQRLAIEDEVAVFAFDHGQPSRLVDFTLDHNLAINDGIDLVSTEGNDFTALFDLLRKAIQDTVGREKVRRRVLFIISDGVDKTSGMTVERVIQEAVDAKLLIYTVGLGPDLAADQPASAFLRRLADETGGKYLWYRPGEGMDEQVQGFLDQLVQQRQGYALRFESNLFEGTPELRVLVQNGGRESEDRASYRVPPLAGELIVNLADGAEVSGITTIEPTMVRNQRPIERVEYRVDGELLHTAQVAPFAFEWDTEPFASSLEQTEAYTLTITAFDTAALQSERSLTVHVHLPAKEEDSSSSDGFSTFAIVTSSLLVLIGLLVVGVLFYRLQKQPPVIIAGGAGAPYEDQSRKKTFIADTKGGMPWLEVTTGQHRGEQFFISKATVYIGRDKTQADIVISWDPRISRKHAQITQQGKYYYIFDLNSGNGTMVNGAKLSPSYGTDMSQAVLLNQGAKILVGKAVQLTFHSGKSLLHNQVPSYHPTTGSLG